MPSWDTQRPCPIPEKWRGQHGTPLPVPFHVSTDVRLSAPTRFWEQKQHAVCREVSPLKGQGHSSVCPKQRRSHCVSTGHTRKHVFCRGPVVHACVGVCVCLRVCACVCVTCTYADVCVHLKRVPITFTPAGYFLLHSAFYNDRHQPLQGPHGPRMDRRLPFKKHHPARVTLFKSILPPPPRPSSAATRKAQES